MATLQELENGLRKAHAAGNAEHARAFADEIRKMRSGQKADFSDVSSTVSQSEPKRPEYGGFAGTDKRVGDLVSGPKQRRATYNLTGVPGVSTQIGGFLDAAQHHSMGALHGVSQFAEHGINALANRLPSGNPVREYINRTVASDDAALRQREADYQARTDGNAMSYAGAVGGEVLPFMAAAPAKILGAVGQGASRLLPASAPVLRKVASGAAQGAAIGAVQPVVGEGSYASQKATQVAVGAGTGGALPALAASARGATNLARHVVAPGSIARDNLVSNLGADASTVNQLRNAPQYVPGEAPTTAQVLANPRAVMTEKALRNNPEYKPQFEDIDNANNAARMDVLRRLGGTDDELTGAVKARRDASAPFRDQNLQEEGSQLVEVAPLVEVLRKRTLSANATVRSAAKEHLALIEGQAQDGKVPAYLLDDLRQEVGGMLAKHAPQGVVGTKEAAKYAPVSAQIVRTLDRQVPGYRDYLGAYRDNSVPINTMETARRIVAPVDQRGLNSAGDSRLTLPALNTGLNRADKSRFGLNPLARQEVEGVRQSLQRESVSNSLRSSGSDTNFNAQSQGWLARQMLGENLTGPTNMGRGLAALMGGAVGAHLGGPAGAVGGAGASLLLKRTADVLNKRIMDRYAAGMKDPQEAARMIEQFLKQNPKEAPALLRQYPQWAALIGQEPAN